MTSYADDTWLIFGGNPLTGDDLFLINYAWQTESIGSRETVPSIRGSNISVPYLPGEVWRPKIAGPKTLSLGIHITDVSYVDGVQYTTEAGRRGSFNRNLRIIKGAFFTPGALLNFGRQVLLEPEGTAIPQIMSAELVGSMQPSMIGPYACRLVVDLLMSDPYWYSYEPITASFAIGAGDTLNNPGDDLARKFQIEIEAVGGDLVNPLITNATNDLALTYVGTIADGDILQINTADMTAVIGTTSVVMNLAWSGSPSWFLLNRLDNTVDASADSGDGTVSFSYVVPYV